MSSRERPAITPTHPQAKVKYSTTASIPNYRHSQRRRVSTFFTTVWGSASRRTVFHRIYARALPPPPGAGEEAAGRAGWGNRRERSAGDGTKARYDLLIWNRCTTGAFQLTFPMKTTPIWRVRDQGSVCAPGPACTGRERSPSPAPTPQGDSHHGPPTARGAGCFPAYSRSLCPMNVPHPSRSSA